jgi:hypothetical protein
MFANKFAIFVPQMRVISGEKRENEDNLKNNPLKVKPGLHFRGFLVPGTGFLPS